MLSLIQHTPNYHSLTHSFTHSLTRCASFARFVSFVMSSNKKLICTSCAPRVSTLVHLVYPLLCTSCIHSYSRSGSEHELWKTIVRKRPTFTGNLLVMRKRLIPFSSLQRRRLAKVGVEKRGIFDGARNPSTHGPTLSSLSALFLLVKRVMWFLFQL